MRINVHENKFHRGEDLGRIKFKKIESVNFETELPCENKLQRPRGVHLVDVLESQLQCAGFRGPAQVAGRLRHDPAPDKGCAKRVVRGQLARVC